MTIEIMNLRNTQPSEPYDFKVDRGTPLGNPFPLERERDRDDVCDYYDKWFDSIIEDNRFYNSPMRLYLNEIMEAYKKYDKVRLFCWCHPKRCHAYTIKFYLEES